MMQSTIKYAFSLSGIGIHSGVHCKIIMHPAPPHTGIVFMVNGHRIPASIDNVTDTRLCTILGTTHRVATIEHVMSAVVGAGIDNILLEVVGPEVPILDGSSCEYYFALQAAGRDVSDVPAIVYTVKEKVRVEVDNKFCEIYPATSYTLDYSFAYFPSRYLQEHPSAHFVFGQDSFEHQLARARTFGMHDDYPKLKAMQCGLGASLDNVLVLDKEGVLNPEGSRFMNEPARHKILDAVGDLALLGARLLIKFIGYGSGHAMHNMLSHKALPHLIVA